MLAIPSLCCRNGITFSHYISLLNQKKHHIIPFEWPTCQCEQQSSRGHGKRKGKSLQKVKDNWHKHIYQYHSLPYFSPGDLCERWIQERTSTRSQHETRLQHYHILSPRQSLPMQLRKIASCILANPQGPLLRWDKHRSEKCSYLKGALYIVVLPD